MNIHRITIRECDGGWFNTATRRMSKTAASAQRAALKRNARLSTKTGCTEIVVLTWEPTTSIGRAVVRAIADS